MEPSGPYLSSGRGGCALFGGGLFGSAFFGVGVGYGLFGSAFFGDGVGYGLDGGGLFGNGLDGGWFAGAFGDCILLAGPSPIGTSIIGPA